METGSSATLTGSLSGANPLLSFDSRNRADTLPTHASQAVERRSTSLTELLRTSLTRKKKIKIFGTPLSELSRHEHNDLPAVFVAMVSFLSQHGMGFEGLFRVSGSAAAISAMRAKIDKEGHAVFAPDTSPAIVSSLLKLFLRELPEPVILPETLASLVAVSQEGTPEGLFDRYRAVLHTLPHDNFALLSHLMELAARVVANKDATKMTPQSMATVLSPNLFRMESQDDILAAHGATNTLISTFITHYRSLFKPAVRIPQTVGAHDDARRGFIRASSIDAEESETEIEHFVNPTRIQEVRTERAPSTPGLHAGAMLSPHPSRRSPRASIEDPAERLMLAGTSTPSPTPDRSSPSSAARRTIPQLASTIHEFLFGDLPSIDNHPLAAMPASGRDSASSREEMPPVPEGSVPGTASRSRADSLAPTPFPPVVAAAALVSQSDASSDALHDEAGDAGADGIAEEMRVLRHKIRDYDVQFEGQHGRPPGHGERQLIARDVLRYKQLRRERNLGRDSVDLSVFSSASVGDRSVLDNTTVGAPVDVIAVLADRAKARISDWYTRNKYSPNELNDVVQLQQEKSELKKILSQFDREFIAEKGREPSREDKLPLLALYQRYKRVKSNLHDGGAGDDSRTVDPNASSMSFAMPPLTAVSAPLPALPVATATLPPAVAAVPSSARTSASASVRSSLPLAPIRSTPAADSAATGDESGGDEPPPLRRAFFPVPEMRRTMSASEVPVPSNDGDVEPVDGSRTGLPDLQESIRYATLKTEKHQLQKTLAAFEAKFRDENGRRVESSGDRMPFAAEYTRYKALKREIAVLEATASHYSPNVTL